MGNLQILYRYSSDMGKSKKTRQAKLFSIKSNSVKREREEKNRGKPNHQHLQVGAIKNKIKSDPLKTTTIRATQTSSALFFRYNTQLGPPYHVLVDTNFVNFSIRNKLDIFQSMLDCLTAKVTVHVTDCVVAELEKLGSKYKLALKLLKDPRFERLTCVHEGTYADDCLIRRVEQHKCFIVATCDRDLKRRIRKIPDETRRMYVSQHKYVIERMPDQVGLRE